MADGTAIASHVQLCFNRVEPFQQQPQLRSVFFVADAVFFVLSILRQQNERLLKRADDGQQHVQEEERVRVGTCAAEDVPQNPDGAAAYEGADEQPTATEAGDGVSPALTAGAGVGISYVENRAHLLLLCQKVFKFKLEIAVVSQKNGDRAARVFARVVLPGL